MSRVQTDNSRRTDAHKRQDLYLLRIFNYYRLVLSLILVSSYFNEASKVFLGLEKPSLFLTTALCYGGLNLLLFFTLRKASQLQSQQIVINICVDLIVLGILTYASGGVTSGLGNLMIVVVAAGSILLTGSYSMLFAALASITLIAAELYQSTLKTGEPHHYLQAGLLGMILFATAVFIKNISRQIHTSDTLAKKRQKDILQLEKINRLIIQRMRTGILVSDLQGNLQMMNDAARELLENSALSESAQPASQLPAPLQQRLQQWFINPQQRTTPFQTFAENPEVQANFASLRQQDKSSVLIFLEDNSKAIEQAQQLKLASLGQLTASIAHEIRNPLGAISHAAQLLAESTELKPADQRLSQIIQEHCVRMNSTIENVLELSRRRPASPQDIPLKSWLEKFISTYNETESVAGRFSLQVMPADLQARFDPSQLQQVVYNLSRNGLRYSQANTGRATLHLQAGLLAFSGQPYLDIMDQGAGIDEQSATRLFEPFFTTERAGTGLGLYISRELCQANNTRLVHLTSYEDGCCFRIIFQHTKQLAA